MYDTSWMCFTSQLNKNKKKESLTLRHTQKQQFSLYETMGENEDRNIRKQLNLYYYYD